MPKTLEQVVLLGKVWFVDERLKQFRNVDNPHEFLSFREMDDRVEAEEFGDVPDEDEE